MRIEKFFLRGAPWAGIVLGIAHGCGANTPSLWWLQCGALSAALAISFLATSNKMLAISTLSALAFSFASSLAAHAWIFTSLSRDSSLGIPLAACVFAALVVGFALLPALSIAFCSALVMKNSYARFAPLALAASYPLAEIASASIIGFSWHSIGYSPLGTPLKTLLPFVGVHGVAAATMLLCSLPGYWWIEWRRGPAETRRLPWRGIAVWSSVVVALALLGGTSYLQMTTPTAQPLRARLLQPALPLHRKFDTARARATTRELVELARDTDVHLVVAPETSLPHSWAAMPSDLGDMLLSVAQDSDRVFLVGLFDRSERGGLLNVSVALHADSRLVSPQRYAKRHLVPVAEQTTPGLRWVSDALALPFADREADDGEPVLFVTRRATIRTTICLDLVYGGELSAAADAVELFVNQSNLIALPGERVRAQLTTIARARALEQQKPVLLVANDGPTAAIDSNGRIVAALPYGIAAGLSAAVQPRHGATVYALLGESVWLVLLAFAGLVLAVARPRTA